MLALFHDSIITVVFSHFSDWPFDLTVLCRGVIVIGYQRLTIPSSSLTVSVRISAVSVVPAQRKLSIYRSPETLRRTIMTISTVLLVVIAMLLLWRWKCLHWFSAALLIGLILGTFSSVYIASYDSTCGSVCRAKILLSKSNQNLLSDEVVLKTAMRLSMTTKY